MLRNDDNLNKNDHISEFLIKGVDGGNLHCKFVKDFEQKLIFSAKNNSFMSELHTVSLRKDGRILETKSFEDDIANFDNIETGEYLLELKTKSLKSTSILLNIVYDVNMMEVV